MHMFVEHGQSELGFIFPKYICEDIWLEEMTNYNDADKPEVAGLSLGLLSHI